MADLKKLAAIAHEKGVPLIADTTVVPFHVFQADKFGVDIEIVSSTKYISGWGDQHRWTESVDYGFI